MEEFRKEEVEELLKKYNIVSLLELELVLKEYDNIRSIKRRANKIERLRREVCQVVAKSGKD